MSVVQKQSPKTPWSDADTDIARQLLKARAPETEFQRRLGRTIARKNAREKIWSLEGYRLRQRLYENECR